MELVRSAQFNDSFLERLDLTVVVTGLARLTRHGSRPDVTTYATTRAT